jgi:hypothetical protein
VQKARKGTATRGYATFNLGYALLKTGRCSEALGYLERALKIEAKEKRPYIRPHVKAAQKCVQAQSSAPKP